MRVIGGQARGRALRAPPGRSTRPTSDRVREAVFSVLASMGRIDGEDVLDLFAGSGALGIESVSRGARRAVLVDSDAEAVRTMRSNVEVLGPDRTRVAIVASDASRYLASAPRFDVVFADPPYDFSGWADLLERLVFRAGLLVAETGSGWDPGPAWETVTVKKYGGTVVSIARPVAGAGQEGER